MLPIPSALCDLFSYKVRSCYVERLRRRCIYKKIQDLTFDLDLEVKATLKATQYPLHDVTYSATRFAVATSNGLGGDTFTRNVTVRRTDRQTDGQTYRQTDGQTDDGPTLVRNLYTFFSKEKSGYNNCNYIITMVLNIQITYLEYIYTSQSIFRLIHCSIVLLKSLVSGSIK